MMFAAIRVAPAAGIALLAIQIRFDGTGVSWLKVGNTFTNLDNLDA